MSWNRIYITPQIPSPIYRPRSFCYAPYFTTFIPSMPLLTNLHPPSIFYNFFLHTLPGCPYLIISYPHSTYAFGITTIFSRLFIFPFIASTRSARISIRASPH